jgi:ribosomal protein S18 acetylase RimI-like enzyme
MPPLNVDCRAFEARDLPEILRIERGSFPASSGDPAWTQKQFATITARAAVSMLIAEDSFRRVRGYIVWQRGKDFLEVLNLAVDPEARRRRIACQLINMLRRTLTVDVRSRSIQVSVPEENLAAQLFFRSSGFRARGTVRDCDSAWIDFYYYPPHELGARVLWSIMEGDGRRVA